MHKRLVFKPGREPTSSVFGIGTFGKTMYVSTDLGDSAAGLRVA